MLSYDGVAVGKSWKVKVNGTGTNRTGVAAIRKQLPGEQVSLPDCCLSVRRLVAPQTGDRPLVVGVRGAVKSAVFHLR